MVCKVKLLFWSRFVIEKCAITFTTSSFGSKIPAMHYVTTYLSPVVLQSVCRRLHICALASRHPCSFCRTLFPLAWSNTCQFPPSATLLASHHDSNNHFIRLSPVPRTALPAGFWSICQPTVSGTSSSNLVCGSDRDGVSPPRLAGGCTTSMFLTTVTPHANRDEPLGPSPISQRGRRDRPSNLF